MPNKKHSKSHGQAKEYYTLPNKWNCNETRKSCSETNTKAALRYRSTTILKYHYFKIVVYDGYVKYEEAEIHRSAIMQDFQDSEFFFLNSRLAAILDFLV